MLLPQPERLVWHKLYASASRQSFSEKASKDLVQAATLAAALTEQEDPSWADSLDDVPAAMKQVLRKRLPAERRVLGAHAPTLEVFELALA